MFLGKSFGVVKNDAQGFWLVIDVDVFGWIATDVLNYGGTL
jgi:hypothetical protein